MDGDLICNFKKCRKPIRSFAWVTSCSHVFCDDDGSREFNKSQICPACSTNLFGKFDIIRSDIQPSEQWKSMVMVGQRPEAIMEICTRALSFWSYQSHQETVYQEYLASKHKEKCAQLQQYYEQTVTKCQVELSSLRTVLKATKKELETMKRKHNELAEKLADKNRHYQKLQCLNDCLRRRHIKPNVFGEGGDATSGHVDHTTNQLQNFSMNFPSVDIPFRQINTPILTEDTLTRFGMPIGTPK